MKKLGIVLAALSALAVGGCVGRGVKMGPDVAVGDAQLIAPMKLLTEKPGGLRYLASPAAKGSATLRFAVPADGEYVIWAYVYGASASEDSFIVSVDGGGKGLIFDIAENAWGTWRWTPINGRAEGEAPAAAARSFNLVKGEHALVFQAREPNARLAKIHVTSDRNYKPQAPSAAPPAK